MVRAEHSSAASHATEMETLGGFPCPRHLPPTPPHPRFARPRALVRADEGEGRRPEGGAGWEEGPESSAASHAT
jgi:hypothetical protein